MKEIIISPAMKSMSVFLDSEKSLYLFAGMVGVISVLIGASFLKFSNHLSFAITMLIIGALEIGVMFPTYNNYQKKADYRISFHKKNINNFAELESKNIKKELRSFFILTLIYSVSIVILTLILSRLNYNSILSGVFTALVLHFAFAITIDSFGVKYTKKYLTELSKQE
ncbi:MAG: hypothetical protein ACJA2N_001281 [Salibacteraceae bacterium]|jgi:hypothetical protein